MRFSLKLFGLEPRVCVESVRDNVAVTAWTTVTTGWVKHADKVRMRKTCARKVFLSQKVRSYCEPILMGSNPRVHFNPPDDT